VSISFIGCMQSGWNEIDEVLRTGTSRVPLRAILLESSAPSADHFDNLPRLPGHPNSCGNPLYQLLEFVRSYTRQAFTFGRSL
jgi:hypothetical protein